MARPSTEVAALDAGLVTAVGLGLEATCAAIRCAIDAFADTAFIDDAGEWVVGAQVPLDPPVRGVERLAKLLAPASRRCLGSADEPPESIPLFVGVSEPERPGRRVDQDRLLFPLLAAELGHALDGRSEIVPGGRIAGALALVRALELLRSGGARFAVVAGVDCFLSSPAIARYEEERRLLTKANSDGFIPGEAASAVLLGPPAATGPWLRVASVGFGSEPAPIGSENPLRADGLTEAVKRALAAAGLRFRDLDCRISTLNGEQYWFKEAALTEARCLRDRSERIAFWHPADCVGEIGAASVPCGMAVAFVAHRKGYAPGREFLLHASNDDHQRAALVLRAET